MYFNKHGLDSYSQCAHIDGDTMHVLLYFAAHQMLVNFPFPYFHATSTWYAGLCACDRVQRQRERLEGRERGGGWKGILHEDKRPFLKLNRLLPLFMVLGI